MITIDDIAKVLPDGVVARRLTAIKTDFLVKRGMQITGFVLTDPKTGKMVTVDKSKVTYEK